MRERDSESNPLTMTVLYGTPSAKYDRLGAGEFHQCSIIQKNLTVLEWKICHLHDVESQNSHVKKECKLSQL